MGCGQRGQPPERSAGPRADPHARHGRPGRHRSQPPGHDGHPALSARLSGTRWSTFVIPNMFRLRHRRLDTVAVVEVTGEVDVTTAPAFTQAVAGSAGPLPLVLDLTDLRYLDSAGFAALDRLLDQRRIVIVLGPHGPTRTAAELVGLPFHDTVDDAMRAVSAS